MFSWGSNLVPPLDIDKEREPPPLPTPVQFPSYDRLNSAASLDVNSDCDTLHRLFSRVKKPSDITDAHLSAFNIRVISNVHPSEIAQDYDLKSKPPYQWQNHSLLREGGGFPLSVESTSTPALMSNGAPFPNKEKYDKLRNELLYENEDAYRSLARQDPLSDGRKKLRVVHARRFWIALQQVSQYWDSSQDNYYENNTGNEASGESNANSETNGHKKPGLQGENNLGAFGDRMDVDSGNISKQRSTTIPPLKPSNIESNKRYKGRRISTGRDMLDTVRDELLRGFVEMVAWSLGCQLRTSILPPRLAIKDLLFPVRQSFDVLRLPQDREEARKQVLEGPLLVVQGRSETHFYDDNGEESFGAKCDILREAAGLLLLAQERARENTKEIKPGEGEWWTTTPRWGGHPNEGPVGEPILTGSESEAEASQSNVSLDSGATAKKRARYELNDRSPVPYRRAFASRLASMVEKWKVVQPRPSLWDRRTKYVKVGASTEKPFDDIFMLSSLNHHFSIVHVRVYDNYLKWLATGETNFPGSDTEDEVAPWQYLVLRRTRWFDFFNPIDRLEGFDGLWAVLTHMMR